MEFKVDMLRKKNAKVKGEDLLEKFDSYKKIEEAYSNKILDNQKKMDAIKNKLYEIDGEEIEPSIKELEKLRKLQQQNEDLEKLKEQYVFPYSIQDLHKELQSKAEALKKEAHEKAEALEKEQEEFIRKLNDLKEMGDNISNDIMQMQKRYREVAEALGYNNEELCSVFDNMSLSYLDLAASINYRIRKGY